MILCRFYRDDTILDSLNLPQEFCENWGPIYTAGQMTFVFGCESSPISTDDPVVILDIRRSLIAPCKEVMLP